MTVVAIEELYSGTETVSTTEWSLTTDTAGPDTATDDAKVSCTLDLANLANGDTYRWRAYEKTLSGDSQDIGCWRFFLKVEDQRT